MNHKNKVKMEQLIWIFDSNTSFRMEITNVVEVL